MYRWTFWLCGMLAVGLAGWGGWLWLTSVPLRPAFVVEEPDRDCGQLPVGRSLLTFRITNQADQPREIIGLAEG